MTNFTYGLVADVGGTNIRLALADDQGLQQLQCYRCVDFDSLLSVIRHYLDDKDVVLHHACIALAGPVIGDQFSMTNLGWQYSVKELQQQLQLEQLWVINDYTAIAMSLPFLGAGQLVSFNDIQGNPNAPMVVCGPGTGLGAAQLVPVKGHYHPVSGEGGHVDFAPCTARQRQLLDALQPRFGHVSIEQVLSGPGLENIYQALLHLAPDQERVELLTASEITDGFINRSCPLCVETVQLFCQILAQSMGNMALTTGALGGMFIAGGIMPRLIDYINKQQFCADFVDKGRFGPYLSQIAIHLIIEPQPGLIGAAAYLKQEIKELYHE